MLPLSLNCGVLGPDDHFVLGLAMDDRCGCGAMSNADLITRHAKEFFLQKDKELAERIESEINRDESRSKRMK